MHLRDADDTTGVARMNEIADIDQPQSDDALDRRHDTAEAQIEGGTGDFCVVTRQIGRLLGDRRLLRVDLLARGDCGPLEACVAAEV